MVVEPQAGARGGCQGLARQPCRAFSQAQHCQVNVSIVTYKEEGNRGQSSFCRVGPEWVSFIVATRMEMEGLACSASYLEHFWGDLRHQTDQVQDFSFLVARSITHEFRGTTGAQNLGKPNTAVPLNWSHRLLLLTAAWLVQRTFKAELWGRGEGQSRRLSSDPGIGCEPALVPRVWSSLGDGERNVVAASFQSQLYQFPWGLLQPQGPDSKSQDPGPKGRTAWLSKTSAAPNNFSK